MACWPANVVGAFFLALLVFDMVKGSYNDMPTHLGVGIVLVILFWAVCFFVGESVSGGILLVPATFVIVFLFSMWLAGRSLINRGCCVRCERDPNGPDGPDGPQPAPNTCRSSLNVTPLA